MGCIRGCHRQLHRSKGDLQKHIHNQRTEPLFRRLPVLDLKENLHVIVSSMHGSGCLDLPGPNRHLLQKHDGIRSGYFLISVLLDLYLRLLQVRDGHRQNCQGRLPLSHPQHAVIIDKNLVIHHSIHSRTESWNLVLRKTLYILLASTKPSFVDLFPRTIYRSRSFWAPL